MRIGQKILAKYNGKIVEGVVIEIYYEDIDIKLDTNEIIKRKFWEIRKIEGTSYEKK